MRCIWPEQRRDANDARFSCSTLMRRGGRRGRAREALGHRGEDDDPVGGGTAAAIDFCFVRTHMLPSRAAVVAICDGSEPKCGSVNANVVF